jgi:AraC family ethanolamine operon transcriptional activator
MGPVAYFRVMRMHSIRSALMQGRGRGVTVADVLARWGVTRPGSFAAEYRRHFGEPPSHTLGVRG